MSESQPSKMMLGEAMAERRVVRILYDYLTFWVLVN